MAINLNDPEASKILEEIFSKCKVIRSKDGSYIIKCPEGYRPPEIKEQADSRKGTKIIY